MKKREKFITLVISLWPLLNVYATPVQGFGIGDLLILIMLPFMLVLFFKKTSESNLSYNKMFLFMMIFIFISLISSLLSILVFNGSSINILKRWLVMIFHIVIFFVCAKTNIIQEKEFKKIYYYIVIASSIAIFLQYISHTLFNENLYLLFKNLKYNQSSLSNFYEYQMQYDRMYLYSFRPTSFFLEPSHFALYISPSIYMFLFKENNKKYILLAFFVSIAILVSTSGVGALIIAFIWAKYILNSSSKLTVKIITLSIITIIIICLANSNLIAVFNNRIKDIGVNSDSSINVRLLKGFDMYSKMNIYEQIIGIGLGGYDSYINTVSNYIQLKSYEYMNSISYILVSAGMIGFILFGLYLNGLKSFLNSKKNACIFWLLIIMYFTGSVAFSCYDTFLLILGSKFFIDDKKTIKLEMI